MARSLGVRAEHGTNDSFDRLAGHALLASDPREGKSGSPLRSFPLHREVVGLGSSELQDRRGLLDGHELGQVIDHVVLLVRFEPIDLPMPLLMPKTAKVFEKIFPGQAQRQFNAGLCARPAKLFRGRRANRPRAADFYDPEVRPRPATPTDGIMSPARG